MKILKLFLVIFPLLLYSQTHKVLSDTSITKIISVDTTNVNKIIGISWLGYGSGGGGSFPVIASYYRDSTGTAATNDTIIMHKPSGVQSGDLLIIGVVAWNTTSTAQFNNTTYKPAGFTFLATYGDNDCHTHYGVFYRVADGSETSTIPVRSQGANSTVGFYMRITGAYTSSPMEGYSTASHHIIEGYAGTNDSISVVGYNTTHNNVLNICLGGNRWGFATPSITFQSGWTKKCEINNEINNQYQVSGAFAIKNQASSGASGTCIVNWGINTGCSFFQFGIRSQ